MKKYLLAAVAALALGGSAYAQSADPASTPAPAQSNVASMQDDVDWKVFGGGGSRVPSVCFFDQKSLNVANDGHVRVWTKCLPSKDVNSIDENSDRGKKLIEAAGLESFRGGSPPVVASGIMKSDDAMGVILQEQVANLNDISPVTRTLYELNCSDKVARVLDGELYENGKMIDSGGPGAKPTAWFYTVPETNGTYLQKILCK
jgi:hypothetical protein